MSQKNHVVLVIGLLKGCVRKETAVRLLTHALRAAVLCLAAGQSLGVEITGVVPEDLPANITVPVAVPLPPDQPPAAAVEITIDYGTGRVSKTRTFAQYEPADPVNDTPARTWFLFSVDKQAIGRPVKVRFLNPGSDEAKPCLNVGPTYRSRYDDPMLHVTGTDSKPILSYWHGQPDRHNAEKYPLNDFIHPLVGLDGEILTATSPGDHIHHRALYWAWVRNERKDLWKGDWWIPIGVHVEPTELDFADGPVCTRFAARHDWVYQADEQQKPDRFVDERVVCRIFKTTDAGRAVDIDLTLTAIGDNVRIGGQVAKDKGYSGMTVRFNDATNVKLENERREIFASTINHLRAKWVDWTGQFNGPDGQRLNHRTGATLMVHPSHPDYPPEWITRYYGPINVAYPGLNMLDLPDGKPLRLKYRIWIHRGDATQGKAHEQYKAYTANWNWLLAISS